MADTSTLATLELGAQKSTNSVIWLHGLGADGNDFAPVVEQLDMPEVRFVLPHAPKRPVTMNNGYVMPAWYDLYGLTSGTPQDAAGIHATSGQINALIEREYAHGVQRIVLAGFSQGGAIALHTALRQTKPLAGVMALSTYLPLADKASAETTAAGRVTPIYMAHGTYDEVITLARAEASADALRALGCALEWQEYPMAHSLCRPQLDDIRHFLQRVLGS
ncbi:alpha/beta hydrolase [Pseudomethylobacillus aquaticus]|uniref:alpha/beta hydrolase n=1 Tax=Pseudomethylobacillus aquaticus TaxID=2676064 RepID=UPI001F00F576|nr:dienelactone hydrolase family protein [Pseudomethylobacillus aquaticus]